MFGKKLKIFSLLGFNVYIDLSWIIIALLITWTLAQGYFPYRYKDLAQSAYWFMGIMGALGLFVSLILHEMSHSIVSRYFGLNIKGITLFIFGGVAEMHEEPADARTEFSMAIAGPIMSVLLGLGFYGIYILSVRNGWPVQIEAVNWYLAIINWLLAGFNMVPAYPLDGGRVLRSALWKWKGSLHWATKFATRVGSGFGIGLIVLGVANILLGNFIGGMWWALIGLFVRSTSKMSYVRLLVQDALKNKAVSRFMKTDPVTVKPSTTIDELMNEYLYRYHHKLYPVVDDKGELKGCITLERIMETPRDQWQETTVNDISRGCLEHNTISPDTDAAKALSIMNKRRSGRLVVVEDGDLKGIITLKDLLEFLSIRLNLEDEESARLLNWG